MTQVISPPVMSPPLKTKTANRLASRGSRLLASLIDSLPFFAVWAVALLTNIAEIIYIGSLLYAGYQIYLLTTQGQTFGKQIMGIKIVKVDSGRNGGFTTNVLLRSVLNSIIGFVPLYSLVDIFFIFREDRRCIHDLIAGTRVIRA